MAQITFTFGEDDLDLVERIVALIFERNLQVAAGKSRRMDEISDSDFQKVDPLEIIRKIGDYYGQHYKSRELAPQYGFTPRVFNRLVQSGLSFQEALSAPRERLQEIRSLGEKGIAEVIEVGRKRGFRND